MAEITITKVKDEYGWLSLMSPHQVTYVGLQYRTCEALFQCMRFQGFPDVQEEFLKCKSPMGAKMIARKNREKLNRGVMWDEAEEDLDRMRLCMKLKIEQHPELKVRLIKTGNAEIIEDCTTHPRESAKFWGMIRAGSRWEGQNMLGKLWMELRDELRKAKLLKEAKRS